MQVVNALGKQNVRAAYPQDVLEFFFECYD